MQLRYVFTELRQGLRRNLSMHLAVVLTLLVSLTLAGVGLLLRQQAHLAEEAWGNQLQLTVYLCNGKTDQNASCTGAVDQAQRKVIADTLKKNEYVKSIDFSSQEQELQRLKMQEPDSSDKLLSGPDAVITASDMHAAYWVTMTDPHKASVIIESVSGLDGVQSVKDMHEITGPILNAVDGIQVAALVAALVLIVAALLLVANTIRLAAAARRREIAIMRLVGASTVYIALPFLLEALVTAVLGVLFAAGTLALVMWLGVKRGLDGSGVTEWVGWHEYGSTVVLIAILGIVLTLVPTLLLTRKYLKV
ncbi:MAG: permease-like cell division protein FtsX [Nocardioides sp.]|uniref:permease-like cell division protein FtsX n=1 Tax=Nocardioides sp. TaxID=35761 RepID=UPI0039E42473